MKTVTGTQQLQRSDWHDPNRPYSFDYEQHILLQLINSTIGDMTVKEKLFYGRVPGNLDRHR